MDSQAMFAAETPQCGAGGGVTARRRSWNTLALGALPVAVLALALYAFPGHKSALWSDTNALSEELLDRALSAQRDVPGNLYADLERHLRWQPSDVRARVFKARLDMRAQRYEQAAEYETAVAGTSRAARDPGVWVEYAEARGMANGGTMAGEPLKLVHKALSLHANHPQALDLAGSAAWEMREFAQAAVYWKQLLMQIPAGTAMHAELSRAIERAEQRARISLPSTRVALATGQPTSPVPNRD
jgi:cytochrome c-type biogenesis protein CcmH/NrfG